MASYPPKKKKPTPTKRKGQDSKVKRKKTAKNVTKAPKRKKTSVKKADGGFLSTVARKKKMIKPQDAKSNPPTYSPQKEWLIFQDGSSRRNPDNPNRKEHKPYQGW